jgi:2-succinyl-6-hydroxy-2,4-cyclohexadiene-1-carboxylate synthase
MIVALHGNVSLPSSLEPMLQELGYAYRTVHLWECLREGVDWTAQIEADDIVLGYSLGGRLAVQALAAGMIAPRALLLLSTHPGLQSAAERAARLSHDAAWAERFRTEHWQTVMAAWNAQALFRGVPLAPEDVAPWRSEIVRGFTQWSLGHQPDLRARLAATACPMLWLAGEDDPKFVALAHRAAESIPQARAVVLAQAGHRVAVQAPGATAAALRAFCAAISEHATDVG